MEYLYNEKRHTLHIKGFCCHTKGTYSDYKAFKTEDDALAYGKTALGWCKICEKKKEKALKESLK